MWCDLPLLREPQVAEAFVCWTVDFKIIGPPRARPLSTPTGAKTHSDPSQVARRTKELSQSDRCAAANSRILASQDIMVESDQRQQLAL